MRRRWTREEDAEVLTVELTPHTDRWSGASAFREIRRQLGRSRVACRSRYYKLQRERVATFRADSGRPKDYGTAGSTSGRRSPGRRGAGAFIPTASNTHPLSDSVTTVSTMG